MGQATHDGSLYSPGRLPFFLGDEDLLIVLTAVSNEAQSGDCLQHTADYLK